jgi:hypothetical protein
MIPGALFCLCLAQTEAPVPPAAHRVVVPDLVPQGVEPAVARTLSDAVLTRLGAVDGLTVIARRDLEQVLDQEQQKQLVGCGADSTCLTALVGALDADRLLTGTVGKLGESHLVTLALLDTRSGALVRRVTRQARSVDHLLEAGLEAADATFAVTPPPLERCVDCDAPDGASRWQVALKAGNSFSTLFAEDLSVSLLSATGDLDVGFRVGSRVALFATAGLRLASIEHDDADDGERVSMQLIPLSLGVRYHSPRWRERLGGYAALSLGAGILRVAEPDEDSIRAAFSARLYGGGTWALTPAWSLLLELNYDITANTPRTLRRHSLNAAALRLGIAYGF